MRVRDMLVGCRAAFAGATDVPEAPVPATGALPRLPPSNTDQKQLIVVELNLVQSKE